MKDAKWKFEWENYEKKTTNIILSIKQESQRKIDELTRKLNTKETELNAKYALQIEELEKTSHAISEQNKQEQIEALLSRDQTIATLEKANDSLSKENNNISVQLN